ncbi:hypothetical protein SCACP_23170 [Sporomusa carbonis]|uniref:hypothetical protein n=1 Tax=Sporomusa carbonis TaxID=3076075 RepID=UPI003A63E7D3
MSSATILNFYESLGFEETEIEDELTTLGLEITPEGHYALITDSDGAMPENLKQEVIFAYYTPDGAFLWSASFKSSYIFKDIWTEAPTPEAKLDAILKYRASNEL